MKKRGQITLFMVIGIILLFSTSLIFYTKEKVQEAQTSTERFAATKTPTDLLPVKVYVENCLTEVGEDAIRLIGANGGYIDIDAQGFTTNPFSPDTQIIEYVPDKIPFWYYTDASDNFASLKPELYLDTDGDNSIEDQINRYVEEELHICFRNFTALEDNFKIIPDGVIDVITTVSDENVLLKLLYPMEVESKATGTKTKMKRFLAVEEVNLKNIFVFINETINAEINRSFLEDPIRNLITIYGGEDKVIPPFNEVKMGGNTNVWARFNVEKIIKNDILQFIRLMRIVNTRDSNPYQVYYTDPANHDVKQGVFNSLSFQLDNAYPDLKVDFFYPGTPIYFDVGGQEVIKAEPTAGFDVIPLSLLPFKIYEYPEGYDLSYPVVMKIEDPLAFDEEGYKFQIALEGNIRNGRPYTGGTFRTSLKVGVPVLRVGDKNLFVDKEIEIFTTDSEDDSPLDGVTVTYICGERVILGDTKMKDDEAVLKTKMPFCGFGGKIKIEKEGYLAEVITYNNRKNDGIVKFDLNLYPVVTKGVRIMKRNDTHVLNIRDHIATNLADAVRYADSQADEITDNDLVLLQIKRVKESSHDQEFPLPNVLQFKTANHVGDSQGAPTIDIEAAREAIQDSDLSDEEKTEALEELDANADLYSSGGGISASEPPEEYLLDLAPGNYTIQATMIYSGPIEIKEDVIDGLCGDEEECEYPCENEYDISDFGAVTTSCTDDNWCCMEPMTLDTWQNGGARANVTITKDMVYSDKNLTLYVFDLGTPSTYDELDTPNVDNYSRDNKDLLKPRFI